MADDLDDFRIQDYVPVKFLDLRWEIRGSTSANDRDSEDDVAGPGPYLLDMQDHEDAFQLNLAQSSSIDGRYYTHKRRWRGRISYDIQGNWLRLDQTEYSVDTVLDVMQTSHRQSTVDDDEYRVSCVMSFLGQQYLNRTLFASADLTGSWAGWFEPGNDATLRNRDVIVSADTTWTYSTERSSDRYADEKRANWTARISGGLGHIEEGSWAYTALSLLHSLDRAGVLVRPLSRKQIIAFCDSITTYRIASPFDQREHRQQALAALASFLVAESLAVAVDPAALLTMQDIWDYYPDVSRSFGWQATIGLGADFSRRSYQSQYDEQRHDINSVGVGSDPAVVLLDSITLVSTRSRSKHSQEELYLLSTVEIHKPLSLRWQGTGTASVTLNLDHSAGTSYSPRLTPYTDFNCTGSFSVDYFHDARSSFGLSLRLQYDKLIYELSPDDRPFPDRFRAFTVNGRASAMYRLSKPTTLGLSLGIERHDRKQYGDQLENNREYLTVNFGASISHFLL